MKTGSKDVTEVLPIVPVDEGTRSMLAYAESPIGRAKIERARQELRDGQGIVVTPDYFVDLNKRIAKRARGGLSPDIA